MLVRAVGLGNGVHKNTLTRPLAHARGHFRARGLPLRGVVAAEAPPQRRRDAASAPGFDGRVDGRHPERPAVRAAAAIGDARPRSAEAVPADREVFARDAPRRDLGALREERPRRRRRGASCTSPTSRSSGRPRPGAPSSTRRHRTAPRTSCPPPRRPRRCSASGRPRRSDPTTPRSTSPPSSRERRVLESQG